MTHALIAYLTLLLCQQIGNLTGELSYCPVLMIGWKVGWILMGRGLS